MKTKSVEAANAFVKSVQSKQGKYAGGMAKMSSKYMHMNAEMMNDGDHAQALARTVTSGLDKTAYPVK